jgi:hypothetical protein
MKYDFDFLNRFLYLASKFKITNLTLKHFWKDKKIETKAEFYADFKSIENILKKCTQKS